MFVFQQRIRNLDLKFGADWYRDKYVHNTGILIQYATSKMQILLLNVTAGLVACLP